MSIFPFNCDTHIPYLGCHKHIDLLFNIEYCHYHACILLILQRFIMNGSKEAEPSNTYLPTVIYRHWGSEKHNPVFFAMCMRFILYLIAELNKFCSLPQNYLYYYLHYHPTNTILLSSPTQST